MTLVESSLAQALHEPDKGRASDAPPDRRPPGVVPPHFYRELTRTAEGCRLLREKGHFSEFVSTIRECGMERDDAEVIVKVKGCLWAVGNVGSMELGAPFIEESNVVDAIIRIAQASEILSLRGTAFFVLGLISRSLHGAEMLDEAGWDGAATTMGESLGLYIPLDLHRFFSVSFSFFLFFFFPLLHFVRRNKDRPPPSPRDRPTPIRAILFYADGLTIFLAPLSSATSLGIRPHRIG